MPNEAEIYQLLIEYQVRAERAEQELARIERAATQTAAAMATGLPQGMAKAETASKGFSSTVNGALQNLGNLYNVVLGGAQVFTSFVKPILQGAVALAQQGAQIAVTRDEYTKLVDAVGNGGDEMLAQMRDVTHGTIADQALMQSALRLTQLAGQEAFTALPTLMAIATQQARTMGISMDYALDSIITGIGRASPLILDNLGITVDMTKANEKLAKSLGVSTSALTKEQRTMALLTEVQRKYGADVEAVADAQMTGTEQLQAYTTQLANARQEIAVGLAPALSDLMAILTPLIQDVLADAVPVLTEIISKMTEWTAKIRENREALETEQQSFERWLRERVEESGGFTPEITQEMNERYRKALTGKNLIDALVIRKQMQEALERVRGEAIAAYAPQQADYGPSEAEWLEYQAANEIRIREETLAKIKELSGETVRIEQETARLVAEARQSAADAVTMDDVDRTLYQNEEEAAQYLAAAKSRAAEMVNIRAAELEATRVVQQQMAQESSEYYTGITDSEREFVEEQARLEEAAAQERTLVAEGLYQDLIALAADYQGTAEDAEAEFLADLAEIQRVHAEDVITLQQDREMARAALIADYQQRIAAAQRAGDADEIARLQSKLNIELVEMGNANAKEDALQDRARKVEEIKRIRAYQAELGQLRAKINDEFAMRLLDAANKSGLDAKVVEAKLKALGVELSASAQVAIEVAKINQQKGKSEWDLAQDVYGASQARINTLLAEAQKRLDIAQGELAAWSPPPVEIPAQIDIDIGYGGIGGSAGDTKREETVVEALDATVGRIVDIVGNAIDTLEKLVGYESRTEEIKEAAQRLGADIRELIAALFPYAESFGRDASGNLVTDWRDIPKAVAEFAGWASSTISAYASAISVVSDLADLEPGDVGGKIAYIADVIGVVIRELDRVRQTFANAEGQWRDGPREAAYFAQYAAETMGVIKAAAEAITALVDLPELEDVGGLLERVKWFVQQWMWRLADLSIGFDKWFEGQGDKFKDKVKAFAELVNTAFSALGRVADAIPKLVDLPALDSVGDVLDLVKRYVAHWLRRMTDLYLSFTEHYGLDDKSPLVAKLAAFAETIDKLFSMLAKVAATVQQLKDIPGFDESSVAAFDRLKRFVAHWLRRMQDLSVAFEAKYGEEALAKLKVFADTIEPLFTMLSEVIETIQKLEQVPEFDTGTVSVFDRLKRFVAHWLRRMQDLSIAFEVKYGKEALAKLKVFADTIEPLFAMLSEVIETIQELERVPEFDTGTVDVFDRLKRFVAHWLRRMQDLSVAFEAKYGEEAAAKLSVFAETLQSLFAPLGEVIAAIQDLDNVPGFDESTVSVFDTLKRYVAHWLRRMADLRVAFAAKYGEAALAGLETFAGTLAALFSLLRDVLDTIGGIRKAPGFDESTVVIFDTLKRYVAHWLRRMADLKEAFETAYGIDATEELKKFAEMLQSTFAALRDLLDLIKQLGAVNLKLPTATFDNLQEAIESILERLELVADQYKGTEGQATLERIAKLSETLGPVGAALSAIVQPFADMSRMRWIPEPALAALKMNVEGVLSWFLDLSKWLSGAELVEVGEEEWAWTGGSEQALADRLEQLKAMAETISPVIASFHEAMASMFDLGEKAAGKTPTEADVGKVGIFIRQVFEMLETLLRDLSFDEAGQSLNPASAVKRMKTVIGGIMEVVEAALGVIDRLLEARYPGAETVQAFVSAIVTMYTELTRVLGLMEYEVTNWLAGISWFDLGADLVQSFIDGIYSMSGGLNQANAWLWSFISGMPGGGGGTVVTPAGPSAGGIPRDTYIVNQYGIKEAGSGVRNALVGFRVYNNLRGR